MKVRWLLITLLLAFPFAFAFFLREARLGEKRPTKPALVVSPLPAPAADLAELTPPAPVEPPVPEPVVEEKPAPPAEPSAPAPAVATVAATPTPAPTEDQPLLLEGTVTKESDALVYETDAKLQLPNNVFLSSPTGVMVSDEQQKIFAGDMQLLTTQQTISANEAVLTLQPGGSSVLTSKTLSIASHDDSTPAMELKGDNLTLTIPAKKTPAAPPASTPDSPTTPAPTTP
jgi:hypothetical protein